MTTDNMIKKVYIETIPYEIDCDMGTQDVAWLAISACYCHGLDTFPISRYIPSLAKNSNGEILHPKLVLCKYDNFIGNEVYVTIKPKVNDNMAAEISADELKWMEQAYSKERFMMTVNIRLTPANDLRRDFSFNVILKYKIHQPIAQTLRDYTNEQFLVSLKEVNIGKNDLYQAEFKIPIGHLEMYKLQYSDKDGIEKETTDFNKNKIVIDKFPDPLLTKDREDIIRKKEQVVREKEIILKKNIMTIEEQKYNEELRIKQLEEFLASIPFTLDEIFNYVAKEIQDANKDLIGLFAYMEKDEFLIHRKLFEIFSDYCKYYDDNSVDTIDIEALMNFFKNYFDYQKEEMNTLLNDLQKYYLGKFDNNSEVNFMDFVFTIIYLLYNIQIYKNIILEQEFEWIYETHKKKLQEFAFYSLYKDDMVIMIFKNNIELLKKLFNSYGTKRFASYYEMSAQSFLQLCKELSTKNEFDFILLTKNLKFLDGLNFFDFLEKIIIMSLNIDESELDLASKIDNMIQSLKVTFEENLV